MDFFSVRKKKREKIQNYENGILKHKVPFNEEKILYSEY
jgi:hypothetical protein